jgi:DedD protein
MQKDNLSDLELIQKKRARRRLVGAIALVLLMIILLPFVLKDRNATEQPSDITISLPNEKAADETDFDSKVVPTETAPKVEAEPTPLSVPVPAPVPLAKQAEAPIVIDDLADETKKDSSASNTAEPAKQAVTPSVTDPTKPPVTDDAKKADNKESVATDKAKKGQFYVQVGVFSDEKNVRQLQAKLSDLGYKSQTEKIDTPKGKKIRLRTQVFGDRNDAAIALENIKDAGLTGMVVSQ